MRKQRVCGPTRVSMECVERRIFASGEALNKQTDGKTQPAEVQQPPSSHCLHGPHHCIACTAPLIALLAQPPSSHCSHSGLMNGALMQQR